MGRDLHRVHDHVGARDLPDCLIQAVQQPCIRNEVAPVARCQPRHQDQRQGERMREPAVTQRDARGKSMALDGIKTVPPSESTVADGRPEGARGERLAATAFDVFAEPLLPILPISPTATNPGNSPSIRQSRVAPFCPVPAMARSGVSGASACSPVMANRVPWAAACGRFGPRTISRIILGEKVTYVQIPRRLRARINCIMFWTVWPSPSRPRKPSHRSEG